MLAPRFWPLRLAILTAAGLVLATVWNLDWYSDTSTVCLFRALTGLPCPGCGTTRAVSALCAGDFSTAWQLNPVGLMTVVMLAAAFIQPNWARPANNALTHLGTQMGTVRTSLLILTILILLWTWNLSRW